MLDGVAKWDYFDKDGAEVSDADVASDSEGSVAEPIEEDQEEEEQEEEKAAAPEPEVEAESELEPDIEAQEEAETTPPASNGKRALRKTASAVNIKAKAKSPVVEAKSLLVTSTSRGRNTKGKEPVSKAKKPVVAPPAKGRGKGKNKVKDVFDMDESE